MYHKHHTKGIVVSGRTEGDSNKLVDIFTENFGMISAKVQGARNINSKLRSGVQDFCFGSFSLISGKSGWKIVSAAPEKNFFEIFKNQPNKFKIVNNILNLIKKITAEEVKLEQNQLSIFNITISFFNFLISAKENDIALAEALTLMRILHSLGFMQNDPELSLPISSTEIEVAYLENIAPKRSKIISLINSSLKSI